MTTTDRDIRTAVEATLGEHVSDHDVEGIVREVIDRHGLVDIDTIPEDLYWTIVQEHAYDHDPES